MNVPEAFKVLKHSMIDDNPSELGSYAHSWHCNVAMMCYDALFSHMPDIDHGLAHTIGNDAASRFMKLCFDVETRGDAPSEGSIDENKITEFPSKDLGLPPQSIKDIDQLQNEVVEGDQNKIYNSMAEYQIAKAAGEVSSIDRVFIGYGDWLEEGVRVKMLKPELEIDDELASHNAMKMCEPDLTKCPECGGIADNGFDRCMPPNPYSCTKCNEKETK